MNPEEFAARRRTQFNEVDDLLLAPTERALQAYARGEADWAEDLVTEASEVWRMIYLDESPNADPDGARFARYQASVEEALAKTAEPTDPPDDAQIDRVSKWLGTYTVNDATWNAAGARGVRNKRWTSMQDPDVRDTHVVADGQIRPIAAPFNVGGYELRFPGDPVGPPEIWINCRCVVQPASRVGEANVTPTTFAITDETDVAVEVADEEDLPNDELEDDEEEITEIPVHGVLAPEGVPTGDGRQFGEGSLTNRTLPLPIAYQLLSGDGHNGSVTVGRIDEIFREGNEVRFRGALVMTKEHTPAVVEGVIDGTVRGISVDVDDVELDMAFDGGDGMDGKMPLTVFSKARIAGVTIVPIPAFQEAFIGLGHEFADELSEDELAACAVCDAEGPDDEDEENPNIITSDDALVAAAGTRDGRGWITHPVPTNRIRRYWVSGKGAAKIRWGVPGDFNRCRRQLSKYITNPQWLAGACANMHKEAIGVWPGRPLSAITASAGTPAPIFNLVAAATKVFDSNLFARVELEDPRVGIVVEGDHVFGYMAQWGVCHIGITGVCTEAPQSQTDYWYYATGVVDTEEGPIHVGQITMDTGHASLRSNAKVAAAHYDNTGSAVADVHVGEDAFGIWFSGVLRSTITDEQLHGLRASGRISGDWRIIGGNLEMVAGLVVNVPGLPIPKEPGFATDEGVQMSLVAAGVLPVEESELVASAANEFDADRIASIVRTAVDEYRYAEKKEQRVTPLRAALRDKQVAALRNRLKGH